MNQKPFHPAADIFPLLEGVDFNDLVRDIRQRGLLQPIMIYSDGSIIDGRNRYRACIEAGVEPRFQQVDDIASPADFVWSLNSVRRHMTPGQRQIAAGRYAIALEAEARGRQLSHLKQAGDAPSVPIGTDGDAKRSREAAATKFNVSARTVSRAMTVIKHGTPEEIKAVETGQAAVSAVAKSVHSSAVSNTDRTLPPSSRRRFHIPGEASIDEIARRMAQASENGAAAQDVYDQFGINPDVARRMMEIVEIADRTDLPAVEQAAGAKALALMIADRDPMAAHEIVAAIAERLWGTTASRKTKRHAIERLRIDQFDRAYTVLWQACRSASDINVPHMPEDRCKEIARELRKAIENLGTLRQKILEIWK